MLLNKATRILLCVLPAKRPASRWPPCRRYFPPRDRTSPPRRAGRGERGRRSARVSKRKTRAPLGPPRRPRPLRTGAIYRKKRATHLPDERRDSSAGVGAPPAAAPTQAPARRGRDSGSGRTGKNYGFGRRAEAPRFVISIESSEVFLKGDWGVFNSEILAPVKLT